MKIQSVHGFLGLLSGVKPLGKGQWKARCPAHDDANPSLSVTAKDDKILVHCHAGCQLDDILGPLRLERRDLFIDSGQSKSERRTVATYDYTDESGRLLYQTVRYEPKDFAQRRPNGNGGWEWNLKGVETVLYRLPEVVKAIAEGRTVWVVEGEKDADNLKGKGFTATCNPMGAGKWQDRYSETLKGANVVVVADRDAPGRAHAQSVARSLHARAASVKLMELPDRDGHKVKDASDWLAAGGTGEELEQLIAEIPEWTPKEAAADTSREVEAGFRLTKLSDLLKERDEDIAYLWENTIIKGGLSLLAAKPKVGKSTLARNLAYALAKGEPSFLGRNMKSSGPVVYLALEEKRTEVKKHFERMGATEDLPIFIHTGSAPERATEELRKAVIESQAVLAIVDPLQRLIRISDLNDYAMVSLALEPVMQIARDTGCHILLIHHANKGVAREGGDSILGSTAIFGGVDCALIMRRTESCRTIESIQRYGEDLPRTVLTFDAVTGLTSSGGSLEDFEVVECEKAILKLLADQEMTEKEVKEAITDHKGGVLSKSLRLLCAEGKVRRGGSGKKGDPYRYASAATNAGDSRDTGDKDIEIPSIPNIFAEAKAVVAHVQNAGDKDSPSQRPEDPWEGGSA